MFFKKNLNLFKLAFFRGFGAIVKTVSIVFLIPTFPNLAIKLTMFYGAMIFFYRLTYISEGLKLAKIDSLKKLDRRFIAYIILQSRSWFLLISAFLIYLSFSGYLDDFVMSLSGGFSIAVFGGLLNEKVRYAARGITPKLQWHYEALRVILEIAPILLAIILIIYDLELYFSTILFTIIYALTLCINYFYIDQRKYHEIKKVWIKILLNIYDIKWFYFLLCSSFLFSLDRLILGFFVDTTQLISYISFLTVIMPPVGFLSYLALWGIQRTQIQNLLSKRYIMPAIILIIFWLLLYLIIDLDFLKHIYTLSYWSIFISENIIIIVIATLVFYLRDIKMQSYFEHGTNNLFYAPIGGIISFIVCIFFDVKVEFYVIIPVVCSLIIASSLKKLYG